MRVIPGSVADKKGVKFGPSATAIRLNGVRIGKEWVDILKNPAKYTKQKLF